MPSHPPQKLEDDSDDDPDFVPPAGGNEGDSDSGSDSGSQKSSQRRGTKRHRPGPALDNAEDRASKEEVRTKLWADFQASVSTPPPRPHAEAPRTVKIVKRYRFAGEDVTKVEDVAEDSPDAKRWPRWDGESQSQLQSQTQPQTQPQPQTQAAQCSPAPTASPSPAASSSGTPQPDAPAATPARTGGPRRPRKSLDAMFASARAKKLSTLDKSAMDWRAHVATSSEIRDDLEAHRRGGGYLEKVEFLQRVEERTEAAREGAKKRRRG